MLKLKEYQILKAMILDKYYLEHNEIINNPISLEVIKEEVGNDIEEVIDELAEQQYINRFFNKVSITISGMNIFKEELAVRF